MSDPTVDAQQPWLGLNSFTESTRQDFHGRDEEVAELVRRVQRKPLTVLFGQSGLGKTSILRAGLVPKLRPEGYCPVYVRLDYSEESPPPAAQIKQAILRETLASGTWTKSGSAIEGESLWEFLHHRDDELRDADGRILTPLLIFDQFEEIFTLAQGNDGGRARAAQFVEQLADLVENRPPRALEARLDSDDGIAERFDFARCDYRILIALREDYLAHLEALKGAMPSITQNRMRLARMTGAQALEAVVKPGGRLVSQEVAEAIVRFVAGGAELRNAEVEPSLLSLICHELNAARIAQGKAEISADLLAGSHATILAEFYERALADQPPGVHRFIEDALLTDSGFRENIAQERVVKAFAEAGAAPGALDVLVDRRLLRVEERLDVRRVELTHDVLCGVVATSRAARLEREAREVAQAQLAAQREGEERTRRALVRARQIAAVCIVSAVVAVGAAGFGLYGMHEAQQTRALAQAARAESERLVVYLLDDFYLELAPVGRLELVGELARRALAYYEGLPAALQDNATRRNKALAQARYATVLRGQGRNDPARELANASVKALDALRAAGDLSEPTTIGLSLGLATQARLGTDSSLALPGSPAAIALAQRGVDVLQAAAKAPHPSVAMQRAYAAALTQLGFVQQRSSRNPEAIATLKASVEAYRGIDGLTKDNDAAANFVISSAWLMDALSASGRPDEALRIGDDARAVATQVLERQPTNTLALRGRALVSSNSSTTSAELLRNAARLQYSNAAAQDWQLLLRIDPSNVITINNLGVARINGGAALYDLGRPRESIDKVLESRDVLTAGSVKSSLVLGILTSVLTSAAFNAADLDLAKQADQLFADASQVYKGWKKTLGPESFEARLRERSDAVISTEWAVARGDTAMARERSRGAREALLTLDAGTDPGMRQQRADALRRLCWALVRVETESNNYAAAERQMRWANDLHPDETGEDMQSRRARAADQSMWALTLAHLGRVDEARPLAAKGLAFQRELHAMDTDDQMHKTDLALALTAQAWVEPARSKGLLAEAQAMLASLPAEARSLRSTRWLAGLLADAPPAHE